MYFKEKSKTNGIENCLCPFSDLFLTCCGNESKEHMGTMAWDVRGLQPGIRYPYFAPVTSKCIKTYPESGQVMWQSLYNVKCSNGYIGKITYMTVHDDSMDAYPGLIIPQGYQLGNMGTKGNATGVHCHIEITQSDSTEWIQNQYGNWCFPSEIDPEDVFFMNDTNILNGTGKWKYVDDTPKEEVDQILHKGSVVRLTGEYIVKDINVKENTALIEIDGKDTWISSVPLEEI